MVNRRRALVLGALLVLLAGLVWLWRERNGQGRVASPTPGPQPVAKALATPGPGSPSPPEPRAPATPPVRLTSARVAQDASAQGGSFEGRVLSTGNGAGVSGAELTFSLPGAAFTTRTDREGRFTFTPRQPGSYRLAAVTAQGFLPYAPEWDQSPIVLTAQPGLRIQGITLFLVPAVEYEGQVVDPSGKPVPGAEVRVLEVPGGESALVPLPSRFTSDEKGGFRFRAPDGSLLEARHPDFAPGRARLTLSAQASRWLTLRLGKKEAEGALPTQRLAGRVLDPAGAPAEGALVTARYAGPGGDLHPSPRTISDAEGHFALEAEAGASYEVSATHPGYVPARAPGVRAGTPEAEALELKLTAGARLTGTVRDARTGAPIPSFTVDVSRRSGLARSDVLTQAVVDPRGHYALPVPVGELAVVVAAYGYGPSGEIAVDVPEDGSPRVADFQLERGGRLSGTVLDEKTRAPIAGAHVSVEGRMGPAASALPVLASATTDEAGQFSLEGLAVGLRSVLVAAEGHHSRILSGLEVQPDGSIGPITVELTPTEKGEEPRIELVGIGAVLQPKDDALVVTQVLPGGGAAEAGLAAGDAVLAVDGAPVTGLGFEGAVQRIRGPEGSTVLLELRRTGGQVQALPVVRRRIRG